MPKILIFAFATFFLAGCSIQRAEDAETAKMQMVGMTKEAIFACMGPPAQKSTEGKTEIWTYNSGNGRVDTHSTASTFVTPDLNLPFVVTFSEGSHDLCLSL